MLRLSLFPAILAAAAYAVPSLHGRQSANPCAGLGDNTYDTAYNFTLAALNTTLSNANITGAPLVLGSNVIDSIPHASAVLATYASYPQNSWPGPVMSLVDGALIPNPTSNGLIAYDVNVTAGYGLGFAVTIPENSKLGAEIYCIQSNEALSSFSHPVLAVNGDTGDFSLCTTTGNDLPAQNNIIYQATAANNGEYDFDSCYPVRLQVVYQS